MSDSPHYVDKAVRLFTFLAKAQLLRQAPVSDIDAYRRDGAVRWLGDLPDAHAVRWGTEPGQAWDQGPLLSIDRLIPADPPRIPTTLDGWITGDALNPTQRPVLAEWRPAPTVRSARRTTPRWQRPSTRGARNGTPGPR